MKKIAPKTIFICITSLIPAFCFAQVSGSGEVVPNGVTVSAPRGVHLQPGDVFPFQLRFSPAPDRFGDGTITYTFQTLSVRENGSAFGSQMTIGNSSPLVDGQSVYTFSITITENMAPGKWYLSSVILGRKLPRSIPIQTDTGFEISPPTPVKVHVQPVLAGTAGQEVSISVSLVSQLVLPKSSVCDLHLNARIMPPQSQSNVDQFALNLHGEKIQESQRLYVLRGTIDKEAPGGEWKGSLALNLDPKSPMGNGRACLFLPLPSIEGDSKFSVIVASGPQEVFPTSVAVTINPSQIDLLHGEADRLNAKAKRLKEQILAQNKGGDVEALRTNLLEAAKDVDKTEQSFKQKSENQTASIGAVNVFFDGVRYEYGEALREIGEQQANSNKNVPRLELVGIRHTTLPKSGAKGYKAALNSIVHNAEVYDFAASTASLTFSLMVTSSPQGATISYKQRGDDH